MNINHKKPEKTFRRVQALKPIQRQNRELELLLQRNQAPTPDEERKQLQLYQLFEALRETDYLGQQSFAEKILSQASFLSPAIWIAQTGCLALLFYFVFLDNEDALYACLLLLSSVSSLSLLYELCKSYNFKMWELEAGCRYNLPQLFFFRLCILSGGDFLVFGGALCGFRMTAGPLWNFCLCALLPFFLSSSLCLILLRRFGNKCALIPLSGIPVFMVLLCAFLVSPMSLWIQNGLPVERIVFFATLGAFLLFLYSAARLCFGKLCILPDASY